MRNSVSPCTFGGYVIGMLGEIPKDGTAVSIDSDNIHVEVLEIKHHRVELCRVKIISQEKISTEDNT